MCHSATGSWMKEDYLRPLCERVPTAVEQYRIDERARIIEQHRQEFNSRFWRRWLGIRLTDEQVLSILGEGFINPIEYIEYRGGKALGIASRLLAQMDAGCDKLYVTASDHEHLKGWAG